MRWMLASTLALLLFTACGDSDKKPANTNPNTGDTGSVYDNRQGSGTSDMDGSATTVREDPDSFTPYEEESDINSTEIGVIDQNANQNPTLDWPPIYFNFDKSDLTDSARKQLEEYAQILRRNADLNVLIEGHSDLRGTENYNLALGERRAQTVKRYLVSLGVAETKIRTISYGELRPVDPGTTEAAFAKNRRAAFTF